MIGQTISHYKILDKLGEGGMGVVYKAEDERLRRTVALKFLPNRSEFEDDRARFEREAQAAAALDHPNICTIYEIDHVDGQTFLAMQLLEGETLDQRIGSGPVPLGEALNIVCQAAEGLAAAHEKGVVHRDIKSANLMLIKRATGGVQVKLMDFGLAQLAGRSKLTQAASILGTIAYMSPEQTQGEAVDQRTDVWALGVVLYEMVAGELPFKGHYDQATMYSILNEPAEPLTAVRSRLPMDLDWIADKCLAKEPSARYQSMGDLLIDLRNLERKLSGGQTQIRQPGAAPAAAAAAAPVAQAQPKSKFSPATIAALGVAAAALTLSAWLAWGPAGSDGPNQSLRRFEITLPQTIPPGTRVRDLAIAPDGGKLALIPQAEDARLWIRHLDQSVSWAVDGTEGASNLFWSPDSRLIGYRAGRQIRTVSALGGPSNVVCELDGPQFASAAWSPDGSTILFGGGDPPRVMEVAAAGGMPHELAMSQREKGLRGRGGFPAGVQMLTAPNGDRLALTAMFSFEGDQIILQNIDRDETHILVEGVDAVYSATGHVLFRPSRNVREIWAVPISLDTLEPTGDTFRIAQGGVRPTVSDDGTLVYIGEGDTVAHRLVWRDRAGEEVGVAGRPQPAMRDVTVSPDGSRIAVSADEAGTGDVWVHEADREVRSRLTLDEAEDGSPVWSPDGRRIAFFSLRGQAPGIWIKQVDGSRDPRKVSGPAGPARPVAWSPDGQYLLVQTRGRGGGGLYFVDLREDTSYEIYEFAQGAGSGGAAFSPDGAYVAYESRETGEPEIFVKSFPVGDRRWQISTDGGQDPRWSGAGGELFYVDGTTIVAVRVKLGEQAEIGDPQPLFSHPNQTRGRRPAGYGVSPDGRRFVLVEPDMEPRPPTIQVVLNWLALEPGP